MEYYSGWWQDIGGYEDWIQDKLHSMMGPKVYLQFKAGKTVEPFLPAPVVYCSSTGFPRIKDFPKESILW